ncbi:hypothetical protein [Phenylobacterium sp.]|jgi:hypothetical protein|uniref:hypothetical protein n=1 Tax=Phenylobacterium sp. TaxID=1871053 RepID=UPI002F3FE201
MTPYRNDAQNPFFRERLWPPMPQTPMAVPSRGRTAEATAQDGLVFFDSQTDWDAAPAPAGAQRRRSRLRLMPLLAAGAVGICGLATLAAVVWRP